MLSVYISQQPGDSTSATMSALQLPFVFAVAVTSVAAILPSYVTVCPRNDPQLDMCFVNTLNNMRPHLIKGISELGVPAIEPLELSEVKVAQIFGDWTKVLLKNVKIRGAGEFNISRLKVNLEDEEFSGLIYIPKVAYEGDYNMETNFMNLSMTGKGSIKGNATECYGHFELRGELEERNGGKYFNFKEMIVNLKVNQAKASITGLINGQVVMGDAVDDVDLWLFVKPIIEETVSEVVLEMVNNIAKHINVDELFP